VALTTHNLRLSKICLHYEPDAAEALACRLEHAISAETATRLVVFLGEPVVLLHGKPNPPGTTGDAPRPCITVNSLPLALPA
jgi:Mn-dependent DtxR family transcriptional regulator